MKARVLIQRTWSVCALEVESTCPAEEYINQLQEPDRKKLLALLKFTADNGPPKNPEKFHKVEGALFEFKSFQDRLLCFFQPYRVIIVTHGFRKKKDRIPPGDIDRAERLRREFLAGGLEQ